jgi:hypothetical protein
MFRYQSYQIYTHAIHQPVAIKVGWSWWGFWMSFLFGISWGLYHRIWIPSFIHALVMIYLLPIEITDDYYLNVIFCSVPLACIWGHWGNHLRATSLVNRGYILQREVYADTESDALGAYYNLLMDKSR